MEMFIQTMGHSKSPPLPPLEQATYNTARQHNTHCFQQELPTALLTQPRQGFYLMLSKTVKPARSEFSYALLNIQNKKGQGITQKHLSWFQFKSNEVPF